LVWFEIMTNFQDEAQNLTKFVHFQKFVFLQILFLKNIWHIGETINTIYKKFQNISFENSSWGKHGFWGKGPQKDNSPKC
jgi:hypothetical protein